MREGDSGWSTLWFFHYRFLHAIGPAKRKKDAPEADVRGTSAETEQRPAQSERLSQLSESLPEWRNQRSGAGFVPPFVTLRRRWASGRRQEHLNELRF